MLLAPRWEKEYSCGKEAWQRRNATSHYVAERQEASSHNHWLVNSTKKPRLLLVDPLCCNQFIIHQLFRFEEEVNFLLGGLRAIWAMNDVEANLQRIIATSCAWDGFNCICGTYFSVQFPETLKALFIDSYRFIGIHVLSCGEKINRFARTCNKRIV